MHPDLEDAFTLTGRCAVVTGAGGGIGRQTAIRFAQAGADVVLADRAEDRLGETAAEVARLGRIATVVPMDVTQRSSVEELARTAVDSHGSIDVWVNIAGILTYDLVVDTSDEELDRIIDVNVKGTFYGCAAAASVMIEQARGRGSIINVASSGMDLPYPTLAAYSMTKAAVASLTRTLAAEVGRHGIRVNTVAPGWVETGMTETHWVRDDGSIDETARATIIDTRAAAGPLGIVGTADDMAWAMLYLASDAARFVTGQVVRPNGGVTMP